METPLLRTKLYVPPTRPELVSRPRLIEQLNTGLPRQSASLSEGRNLSEGRFARKLTPISIAAILDWIVLVLNDEYLVEA